MKTLTAKQQYNREYYKRNKERLKAKQQRYAQEHPDKRAASLLRHALRKAAEVQGRNEVCDSCGDPAELRIAVSRDRTPTFWVYLVLCDDCADGYGGLTELIQEWC